MVCQKEGTVYAVCSQFDWEALERFVKIMVCMIQMVTMIVLCFLFFSDLVFSFAVFITGICSLWDWDVHVTFFGYDQAENCNKKSQCNTDIVLLTKIFPFAVQLDFYNFPQCSCLSNKMKYVNQHFFFIYKGQFP